MRTRRSPRNQEILWRALGGNAKKPIASPAPIRSDEEIDAMWWVSKTSRSMMKRDAAKARAALEKGEKA